MRHILRMCDGDGIQRRVGEYSERDKNREGAKSHYQENGPST
ncbi:hypothetical protein CSIRO_1165 [Bradyrhizobiaceae bacterium SG-6C]|nr:hypothetical protein CSIRO_1165 [Bradyrhizobiaceae bacterium SG-6C]